MTAMVGGDDDEALSSAGVDDTKKSERKRKRERQRRSDLTNALDELAALVAQIDPDEHSDSAAQKKRRRKSGETEAALAANDPDSANMTRLDLVGRTTMVLRRLQRENSELKRRLDEQHNRSAGDDKEVLVMVPTLTIVDNQDHPSRGGLSPYPQPPPYYHQQHSSHPDPSYAHAQPPPRPPLPPPQSIHLGSHYYSPGPPGGGGASYHLPSAYSNLANSAPWGSNVGGPPPPGHYPPMHYQQPMQDPRGPGGMHGGPNPDEHGTRRDI